MAKNLLENAGHGSLGNKIFNVLRDKILNEEYVQGQKLNEVALSKELNISCLLYTSPSPRDCS